MVKSNTEAKHLAMTLITYKLVWLKQLIQKLKFADILQISLLCDNQSILHISFNPVFHKGAKHIKIDCHFIREKIIFGHITTSHVNSND